MSRYSGTWSAEARRCYCALVYSKLEVLGFVCLSGVARQQVLRDTDALGL